MKKTIAIIGGGAAALLLAATLDEKKYEITVYEQKPAVGRKLLVAGDGGFNLTHSEPITSFLQRYTPVDFLKNSLLAFTNEDLRNWLHAIGIGTYVGSSKRVYPEKGIKPIEVLNAILNALKRKQVIVKTRMKWCGWNSTNELLFNENKIVVKSDLVVFALGGASWESTGSDGSWMQLFQKKGIPTHPFLASNCNFPVKWHPEFIEKHEGTPIKNIALRLEEERRKGEIVVTKTGIEGGPVYALSPSIRMHLFKEAKAVLHIDLKPSLNEMEIQEKLKNNSNYNTTALLKNELHLSPAQIALLKCHLDKAAFMDPVSLSYHIKNLPITVTDFGNIAKAISTAGGVALDAVSPYFELKNLPQQFVIGEMLDWDAPTGGYLLQGCFSMGHYLAGYLNSKV